MPRKREHGAARNTSRVAEEHSARPYGTDDSARRDAEESAPSDDREVYVPPYPASDIIPRLAKGPRNPRAEPRSSKPTTRDDNYRRYEDHNQPPPSAGRAQSHRSTSSRTYTEPETESPTSIHSNYPPSCTNSRPDNGPPDPVRYSMRGSAAPPSARYPSQDHASGASSRTSSWNPADGPYESPNPGYPYAYSPGPQYQYYHTPGPYEYPPQGHQWQTYPPGTQSGPYYTPPASYNTASTGTAEYRIQRQPQSKTSISASKATQKAPAKATSTATSEASSTVPSESNPKTPTTVEHFLPQKNEKGRPLTNDSGHPLGTFDRKWDEANHWGVVPYNQYSSFNAKTEKRTQIDGGYGVILLTESNTQGWSMWRDFKKNKSAWSVRDPFNMTLDKGKSKDVIFKDDVRTLELYMEGKRFNCTNGCTEDVFELYFQMRNKTEFLLPR